MAKFFRKSQSAFVLFQEQSDKLVKEINKDLKKCNTELKKKQVDEITRKYLGEICSKNLERIADEKEKLSELKEENEPKPIPKFEAKKEEKLKKLNNLEVLIKDVCSKLDITRQSGDQKDAKAEDKEQNFAGKNVSDKEDGEGSEDDEEEEEEDDDDDDDDDDDIGDDEEIKKTTQRKDSLKDTKSPEKSQKGDGLTEAEDDDDDDGGDDDKESKPESSTGVSSNNKTSSKTKAEPTKKKSVTLVTDKSDDDEDVDDDDDEEDEDEEEEDGDDSVNLPDGENIFVAIKSFPGQEEGDLTFEKNEQLKVIRIRSDGWMVAVNNKGDEGLVPGNFFEKYSSTKDAKSGKDQYERQKDEVKDEDEEEADDDDDDDDDDEEEEEEEEGGDELISDHDDESKESKNVKKHKKAKGGDLWSHLRTSVSLPEDRKAELIRSLSSVPSGYREPTLSRLSSKTKFSLKYHMHPTLSVSCLNFKDLAMDVRIDQVEPKKSRIQCILDLISIRNLPLPKDETAIKILDSHVRICLFDGQNFLSNLVIVKVPMVGDGYKLWKFNKQTNCPSLEFSQIFIRSNSLSPEIGVLLEVSATLQTEIEVIELSCGWTFFKLLGENGFLLPNKTYYLPINGGTPFEKGIPIDKASDPMRNRKFSFASVLKSVKELPIFALKLRAPKKTQNLHLETLPQVMIGQTCILFYLHLYRQFLADALIKYRSDLHSTEVLHSPLLVSLTEILERSDLLDVLRGSWTEKLKSMTRSEKRNLESVKASFLAVFMENVYPLMFLAKMRYNDHMNINLWKKRSEEVQSFTKDTSGKQLAGLELFTKPNVALAPFDTNELIFNLLDSNIVNISLKNKS